MALSSLLTQIPVIRNSIVFFILLLAQLLFVFIFHHNIKKMKIYGTVITALAVSNITSSVLFAWCWAYQSINSISVPIKQGTDILGIVMAKASFGMFAYLISGIAIVVFAECIVSVFIKYRTKKETTAYSQHLKQNGLLNKNANPFYYVDTLKQPDQLRSG